MDASSRLGLNKTLTHTRGCAHLSQDVDELGIWRACLAKDAVFIKVCRAAAQAAGEPAATGESLPNAEAAICHSNEARPILESQAYSMGLVATAHEFPGTPPWKWRGVSGDALQSDADYAKACNAAFEAAGRG